MQSYKASIITIGDEILIGQIVDSNSAWLADKLFYEGFQITEIRSISDDPAMIQYTVDQLIPQNDLVILTGGLGPTSDDKTKNALNTYFKGKLVFNEAVLEDIKLFIQKKRGCVQLSENNRAQAMVSNQSKVLRNPVGTAPVQVFEQENTTIVSLPGVPFEMKHLYEHVLRPELHHKFSLSVNQYKTLHVVGFPESELANRLSSWEQNLPPTVQLAYLPSPGVIRIRLYETGNQQEVLDKQVKMLYQILDGHVIAEGKEKVEFTLGKILRERSQSIAVAESCTGGLLGHRIASVSGASDYFRGGIIAYSNAVKRDLLHVRTSTINNYGAVSENTAKEMAIGAARQMQSDIAIATTGIAGPGGGTPGKPVGTVYAGFYIDGEVTVRHFMFTHDRLVNIERTSTVAMYELIRLMMSPV